MDKTVRTEWRRTYLVEELPAPLTPSSAHIQIFDNYIADTRLRLRSVRDPADRSWKYLLQQLTHFHDDACRRDVAAIVLSKDEYPHFKIFEEREIRKNRYFHAGEGSLWAIDVYLGRLWGLIVATATFSSEDEFQSHQRPGFASVEISAEPFFWGCDLVSRSFSDVQAEAARLSLPADGAH